MAFTPIGSDGNKVVFFGYGTYDAAMNMAIDEALLKRAAETGKTYIRFYNFDKPSVILSISDHWEVLKEENLSNVDLTRRITGGKPIYADSGSLCYSIAGPTKINNGLFSNEDEIHRHFGNIIASAIASTTAGANIELGEYSSIKADGKPIAGHGQHISKDSFLYHGIMAITEWDANTIGNLIQIPYTHMEQLRGLPSISSLALRREEPGKFKDEIMAAVLGRMPVNGATCIEKEEEKAIMELALSIVSKYRADEWIYRRDIDQGALKRDSTFCLLYTRVPQKQKG